MAHSAGTQGPTRSEGSRQLTSTCGTPWHMGIGQVQTVASAVARRTRATAETAVSTIWSVCGRLWRFACAFRTTCRRRSRRRAADRPEARAVASAPEGAACDRTEPRSSRGTWPASAAALGGCAAPCGRGRKGIYRRVSCHESAGGPQVGLARPGTGECAWASERREGKDVQGLRGCLRRAGRHRG